MSQRRILIVEDEAIIAMDIQETLERFGYSVCGIAASSTEAVELACELNPELILMDIFLKHGSDGINAAREIKKRLDVPIVFLTAYSDEETMRRATITEPYGYLLKPFEKRELQIVIEISLYKHQAEKALREKSDQIIKSSEEIRDLYNKAPCGYHSINAQGVIVNMNETELQWLGYSAEEVIGKRKITELVTAASQKMIDKFFPLLKQQGEVRDLEMEFIRKNGTLLPVLISSTSLYDTHGNFVQSRAAVLDMTERKQAELEKAKRVELEASQRAAEKSSKKLAFLAQAGSTLVSTLDFGSVLERLPRLIVTEIADWCAVNLLGEDGLIQRVSIAHRDSEKEQSVRLLLQSIPPSPMDAPYGVPKVIQTGQSELWGTIPDSFLQTTVKDQKHFDALKALKLRSLMIVPLHVRQQTVGALLFATSEDSSRTYTEEDLAFAEEIARRASIALENATLFSEAQEAIRTRDEFLSIASHELKTPLTSLDLQVQIVKRKLEKAKMALSSGKDGQTALEIITSGELDRSISLSLKQIERLTDLINELLDTTRIRLGRLELHKEETDLVLITQHVLERFESDLLLSGVQITLQSPDSLTGWWDSSRIDQVINNLVSNALKYGEKRPIEIIITQHDHQASLKVCDHGMGIPPTEQKRIFERFERAASFENISGLGLGLYISRQIVEAHGGSIKVESETNKGSTFTIMLPLEKSPT